MPHVEVFAEALLPPQPPEQGEYDVDVRQVASHFGGGGHKNAAGFTVMGQLQEVRADILALQRETDGLLAEIIGTG